MFNTYTEELLYLQINKPQPKEVFFTLSKKKILQKN